MCLKKLFTAAVAPAIAIILPAHGEALEIGAALPALNATGHDGKPIELAKAGAKGWTLVYFYPKADTPGCTKQACSLRDSYEQLTGKGVKVFGVSMDSVADQKAFAEKFKLPFILLADPDGKVVDAFGVPRRAKFAKRQAFLFKDGKLAWRDLTASTAEQAADVLKQIR
jgi:peroxiredoxin Q/BCP